MPEPLRIATVRFLNAWPLTEGLAGRDDVAMTADVPARVTDRLRTGEADVALVPSIEYPRLAASPRERARPSAASGRRPPTGFVALRAGCVASAGPVRSVRLVGTAPLPEVRRVLLDPASRTSNALCRVLLARRWRLGRAHCVYPDEAGAGGREPDARLVVGDRGLLHEAPSGAWERDLGAEWDQFAHRPFVYAFWVARDDADLERAETRLAEAKAAGLAARPALAARAAETLGIDAELAEAYLTEHVHYRFGRRERQGLHTFWERAADESLAPPDVRLRLAPPTGAEEAA